MKRIAVIGGGGTGIAVAGDLTERGFQVALCDMPERFERLAAIRDAGGVIELTGARSGTGRPELITSDLGAALRGAELVLVCVMAVHHATLAEAMAEHLKDGQTVCFSAGNCGSIILKRKLGPKRVTVGEMQGNIFPARLRGINQAHTAFQYAKKKAAAFPAGDTPAFLKALEGVYDCTAAQDVFETTLNSPNVSVHLAASLLNIAKMETMEDFRLYRDGLCPSVLKLIAASEQEKSTVMEHMGYACTRSLNMMETLASGEQDAKLALFKELEGPIGVGHRYFTEDAFAGNSLLVSLGNEYGIPTPISYSLIALIKAINGEDYFDRGITLKNLGLSGKSVYGLRMILIEGW